MSNFDISTDSSCQTLTGNRLSEHNLLPCFTHNICIKLLLTLICKKGIWHGVKRFTTQVKLCIGINVNFNKTLLAVESRYNHAHPMKLRNHSHCLHDLTMQRNRKLHGHNYILPHAEQNGSYINRCVFQFL